jgi:hypothetical protein
MGRRSLGALFFDREAEGIWPVNIGKCPDRPRAQSFQIEPIGAPGSWQSMVFPENRFPFFPIML